MTAILARVWSVATWLWAPLSKGYAESLSVDDWKRIGANVVLMAIAGFGAAAAVASGVAYIFAAFATGLVACQQLVQRWHDGEVLYPGYYTIQKKNEK